VQDIFQDLGGFSRERKAVGALVQPLFVYLVGLENDRVEDALLVLGQSGERLIVTASLEVSPSLHHTLAPRNRKLAL